MAPAKSNFVKHSARCLTWAQQATRLINAHNSHGGPPVETTEETGEKER